MLAASKAPNVRRDTGVSLLIGTAEELSELTNTALTLVHDDASLCELT